MTQPRWLDDDEQRAWRGYTEMYRRLTRVLGQRLFRDSGLSHSDYELLVPLSEAPGGQLRARDLAKVVDWEKSRLSHHLTRMEQRGLVERRDCPTDARGAFIALSGTGRLAIEAAAPQHAADVRESFIDLLSADEIAVVAEIAERVLGRLERVDVDSTGCSSGASPPPPCDRDGLPGSAVQQRPAT